MFLFTFLSSFEPPSYYWWYAWTNPIACVWGCLSTLMSGTHSELSENIWHLFLNFKMRSHMHRRCSVEWAGGYEWHDEQRCGGEVPLPVLRHCPGLWYRDVQRTEELRVVGLHVRNQTGDFWMWSYSANRPVATFSKFFFGMYRHWVTSGLVFL
jgi:hypothetical protein